MSLRFSCPASMFAEENIFKHHRCLLVVTNSCILFVLVCMQSSCSHLPPKPLNQNLKLGAEGGLAPASFAGGSAWLVGTTASTCTKQKQSWDDYSPGPRREATC